MRTTSPGRSQKPMRLRRREAARAVVSSVLSGLCGGDGADPRSTSQAASPRGRPPCSAVPGLACRAAGKGPCRRRAPASVRRLPYGKMCAESQLRGDTLDRPSAPLGAVAASAGSAAAAPTSQWVRAGPRSPAPARSALTRLNISGKADPTRPKAVPPLDLAPALVAGDDLGGPVPPAGVDAAGQSRGCVTGAGNAGARRLPARLPQRGLVDRGSLPPDPQRPMVVPPLALPEVLWG